MRRGKQSSMSWASVCNEGVSLHHAQSIGVGDRAVCRRPASSIQFASSVGRRIAASRCFPSLVPSGSLEECHDYMDITRRTRQYGFCWSYVFIHGRPAAWRQHDRHWYTYEMYESQSAGAEAVVEGKVLSLNRSAHGMLLLMSEPPCVRQLVALSNPRLGWYRSAMVYEICWVRALPIESERNQFLVGCRHVTAASR